MADDRRLADVRSLRPVIRAAFGKDRRLLRVERLAGGSKKGAYHLMMDDGGTALVYAWDDSEDYWREWFRSLAEHHLQCALQFPA